MIERYTLPEMGAVWSQQNKFQKWLDVEIAVCEVHAEDGTIPADALAEIKAKAAFSVDRISEIEKTTDHDVIAFTTNLAENTGSASRFVHYGLTSSDVVDTANALLLREACDILLVKIDALLDVLKRRAFEFKDTPQIGRTHGIHAEPTSFGLVWALWYSEMQRNRRRLVDAREAVAVGKISGAVGAFAHLDPSVEERVCAKLGLKAADVSTQVIQRDRYAEYLCTLAIIASTLEKMALQVRHWQRTEVREAQEAFKTGQKARRRCRINGTRSCRNASAAWPAPCVQIRSSDLKMSLFGTNATFRTRRPNGSCCLIQALRSITYSPKRHRCSIRSSSIRKTCSKTSASPAALCLAASSCSP